MSNCQPAQHVSKFLVVDDQRSTRTLVRRILAVFNAEITEAENGEEALRLIREQQFDVIFLDINMPGISGLEVCSRVRRDLGFDKLPIIIMTSLESRDLIEQAFATGATDYINKTYIQYEMIPRTRAIMERRNSEHELYLAKKEAELANSAKGNFLANMSHEIRTPMNAIIGLSHLCMQTELTPKQKDYLQKIYGSSKVLVGIINDILDFSKIDAGKMEMERMHFELDDVMSNMATVISTKAEEKGLEFLHETSLDVPQHLIGDPLRLGQVLINLAGNAVKFTDKGEVLVLAEIEEEMADDIVLRFTIRDSGIGMTQEQIDKLFHAFTQADSTTTRKFGGTGLGLSISKQLVSLMKGKIWVESTPGEGSKFIFTAHFGKAEERRTGKRHMSGIDLRGMRVLAVDDNATSRNILQSYLESFGFKVAEAVNGIEALHAIEQAEQGGMPYQFVVLDWKMPLMDGVEAARKIRNMAGLSHMPKILLISSYTQNEILKHLEDNLFDGILAKPFQQSELFNAAMRAFGGDDGRRRRGVITALFNPDLVAKISGAHLLLVEDNEINQQIARELLDRAGVTVTVAENGEEAVARVLQEKFDGVLMDMQMPVMDGITATREIRKNPKFADLPIIAMTANVMINDRERCLAAGMNDYIAKPIDPNQMVDTLAEWVIPSQPAASDLKAMHANRAQWAHREDAQERQTATGALILEAGKAIANLGGEELYLTVIEKFIANQGQVVQSIVNALAANDRQTAERLAHTLRGLAATIGAATLAETARHLDAAIRKGDTKDYPYLIEATVTELDKVIVAVNAYLQAHAAGIETIPPGRMRQPLDQAQLDALLAQLTAQLRAFDSEAGDTMRLISRQAEGVPIAPRYARLNRYINDYDYENALAELQRLAMKKE